MNDKLLTIIIPCFNVRNKVKPILLSLKEIVTQIESKYIEILFIDDGSKDNSKGYIENNFKNRSNVKILRQENKGVSCARNRGIELAKGKFITFIDADDNINVSHFFELFDLLQDNKADIINAGVKVKEKYVEKSPRNIIPSILGINDKYTFGQFYPGPVSKFYKAEFLRKNLLRFPIGLDNGEDIQFNIDCLIRANSVYFYPISFYLYRVGQLQSLTSKRGNNSFFKGTKLKRKYLNYLLRKHIINNAEFHFAVVDVVLSRFILFYGFSDENIYFMDEIKDIEELKRLVPELIKNSYIKNFKTTKQILLFILIYIPRPFSMKIVEKLAFLKNKNNKRKVKWIEI